MRQRDALEGDAGELRPKEIDALDFVVPRHAPQQHRRLPLSAELCPGLEIRLHSPSRSRPARGGGSGATSESPYVDSATHRSHDNDCAVQRLRLERGGLGRFGSPVPAPGRPAPPLAPRLGFPLSLASPSAESTRQEQVTRVVKTSRARVLIETVLRELGAGNVDPFTSTPWLLGVSTRVGIDRLEARSLRHLSQVRTARVALDKSGNSREPSNDGGRCSAQSHSGGGPYRWFAHEVGGGAQRC